jgi:hypothetical protein
VCKLFHYKDRIFYFFLICALKILVSGVCPRNYYYGHIIDDFFILIFSRAVGGGAESDLCTNKKHPNFLGGKNRNFRFFCQNRAFVFPLQRG